MVKMPPLALLAPLAGSLLGSTLLPTIAGSSLLGIGTSTLGGALGGALAGGLTNQEDPLMGALLGGAGGAFAGPGLSDLAGSAVGGIGDLLGMGAAEAVATGAPTSILPAAGVGTGSGLGLGEAAATGLGTGAGVGGGAGVSAEALASGAGMGADGLATGLDSLAGGVGGDLASSTGGGTLAEALVPGGGTATSTLPTGPAATVGGGALPAATGTGVAPVTDAIGGALGQAGDIAAAGALPAGPTSSIGQYFADPTFGNLLNTVDANKGLLAAAVPMLAPSQSFAGEDELKAMAANLSANSTALSGYLSSGTLPPGLQAGLNSAREAAKASMRSMFASRGMSGSSSEVAALANIDQTTAAQGAQIAMQLLDRGIQQGQLSSALYQNILRNAMAEDAAMGEAVGRFAAALAA